MGIEYGVLSAAIRKAWEKATLTGLTSGRSPYPPSKRPYVYASAFRECTRRMVLEMVEGDKQPTFDAEAKARMDRGEDRERDILLQAARVGQICDPPFQVIGQQQRFELKDRKGRVVIVGKTDARLQFAKGLNAPAEVKCWQLADRIERFEDLLNSPWTKSGAYQLLSYLYGSGEPVGFLLLDRPGLPNPIEVHLEKHLDLMEAFLQKAEIAMDCKELGTLPDFCGDAEECGRCWCYGGVCNPPIAHAGAAVFTDPQVEADLVRAIELKPLAGEYEKLWDRVKKVFRGVPQAICGSVVIEGKYQSMTRYDYPAEVETQIEAWKKQYGRKDPEGKFVITVTRLLEQKKQEAA